MAQKLSIIWGHVQSPVLQSGAKVNSDAQSCCVLTKIVGAQYRKIALLLSNRF
jgi:hypothetical protein